jgi:hypothetical protein
MDQELTEEQFDQQLEEEGAKLLEFAAFADSSTEDHPEEGDQLVAKRLRHIAEHLTSGADGIEAGDAKAAAEMVVGVLELDEMREMIHQFQELQVMEQLSQLPPEQMVQELAKQLGL